MKTELAARLTKQIEKGITVLRKGGVIAYPTDTVFGVGSGIYSDEGIKRIFELKKRTGNISLPVLLAEVAQVHEVAADIPPCGWKLIDRFWPGGLTLIVYRSRIIKDIITGGGDTVAIRVPDHPVPYHLIKGSGMPLIGTGAQICGEKAVVTAEAVKQQFKDGLDLIIDGGPAPGGIESTIIDITGEAPVIIRKGCIRQEEIELVVGKN